MTALIVGAVLALGVGAFATALRLDRERGFYPTVMIVIASYYALFAVLGGSTHTLVLEVAVASAFVGAAALGFRGSPWILVAALAAHGVFDLFHGHLITNPGVPAWYPLFCLAYDLVAAAYLAGLLQARRRILSRGSRSRGAAPGTP